MIQPKLNQGRDYSENATYNQGFILDVANKSRIKKIKGHAKWPFKIKIIKAYF